MYCEKCGTELSDGAVSCPKCDTPYETKQETSEEKNTARKALVLPSDVKYAKRGDEKAFENLYRASHDQAFFVARRLVGSDEAAAAVLQDAYVKAFATIKKLANPEDFQGWFNRIVAHVSYDHLRQKDPHVFSTPIEQDENEVDLADEDLSVNPEAALDKEVVGQIVRELFDSLSAEQRLCIMSYYFNNMSLRDIAFSFNIPESTMKTRLSRARKEIEVEIKKRENEGGIELFGATPFALFVSTLKNEGNTSNAPITASSVIEGVTASGALTAAAKGGPMKWIRSHVGASIAIGVAIVAIISGIALGANALITAANEVVPEPQVVSDMQTADIASVAGATLSYVNNDAYTTVSVTDISEQRDKTVANTVKGTCKVTLENTPSQVIADVSFTYKKEGNTWNLTHWEITSKQVTARCGVDSAKVIANLAPLMATADATAKSDTSLDSIYGTTGVTLLTNATTKDGGNVTFNLAVDDAKHSASGTLTVGFTFENGNWKAAPVASSSAYTITNKTKMVWILTSLQSSFSIFVDYANFVYDTDGQLISRKWIGEDGSSSTYVCQNGMVTSETVYPSAYPGTFTWAYTYDARGLCTGRTITSNSTDSPNHSLVATYDSSGNLLKHVDVFMINGSPNVSLTTTFSYSGNRLVSSLRTGSSLTPLSYSYTYDANGNVATATTATEKTIFTWKQIEIPADVNAVNGMNIVWKILPWSTGW